MAEREPISQVAKLKLPRRLQYNFWYDYNENDTVFIFVHGIFSNSLECWTYEDKQDPKKSCYWPDLIREDNRFGSPSIYMGGYFTKASAGDLGISPSAQILFNALRQTDVQGRPGPLARRKLVFVCHSTGGIVTRYLIREHGDDLAGKAVGLVLIASPSLGSIEANKLQSLAKFYNNQLGLQLRIGDPVLDDLDNGFRGLVYSLQNASDETKKFLLYGREAYETYYILRHWLLPRWLHSLVPNRRRLVPSRSANVYFGLADPLPDTDHFETVKPSSPYHPSHAMLALFWEDFKKYLAEHQRFFSRQNAARAEPRAEQEAFNAAGHGIELINSLKAGDLVVPVLPSIVNLTAQVPMKPDQQKSLTDTVKAFRKYSQVLGFQPGDEIIQVVITPSVDPSTGADSNNCIAIYDPDTREMVVASFYADDTNTVLRQYAHHLLLNLKTGITFTENSGYYAIESGLASYFPASFNDYPLLGDQSFAASKGLFKPQNLNNQRALSEIRLEEWASVQNDGSEIWGGILWQIRGLMDEGIADKLIFKAWDTLTICSDSKDAYADFAQSLLEADQLLEGEKHQEEIKDIFSRRGLTL
jgi:hypothetical protein